MKIIIKNIGKLSFISGMTVLLLMSATTFGSEITTDTTKKSVAFSAQPQIVAQSNSAAFLPETLQSQLK